MKRGRRRDRIAELRRLRDRANEVLASADSEEAVDGDAEIVETAALVEARLKRDQWRRHASGSSGTAYAREQAAFWDRRVAELEQEHRPIPALNIINGPFANADEVVSELRSIRDRVEHGEPQMEML